MRKLALVLVLAMAVPAMATVTFTAVDNGDQTITISYSSDAGDAPRGVGLRVDVTAPVAVQLTEFAADAAYNTFIDYAHSNPLNFAVGDGHPFADATAAGALGEDAVTSFSISMGVLDEEGGQAAGPDAADLITFKLCGEGTVDVTISADTLRGPASGVVGSVIASNLETAPITLTGVNVVCGGEPACWSYDCHGFGDSDGDCDVDAADVGVAVGGWNNYEGTTNDIPNKCADTDSDGDVDAADIGNLVTGWNNGCGECTPK
ncbi:MAG: hypothetical protein JXA82_08055 [Sedimentisphaerales bacterium]|nr:hypothetical protein [Sedimentisphaerales bacterium]